MKATRRGRWPNLRAWLGVGTVLAALVLSPSAVGAATEAYLTDSATLLVADTENPSVIARIPVGGAITALPVTNGSGSLVFVPLEAAVAVVDTASRTVIRTIPVSARITELLVDPQAGRLYAASVLSPQAGGPRATVTVIDTGTLAPIASLSLGNRIGPMGVDPTLHRLYAPYEDAAGLASVAVIDVAGSLIGAVSLPFGLPEATVVQPARGLFFAAARDQIAIVNAGALVLQSVIAVPPVFPSGTRSMQVLRLDPGGNTLYAFVSDIGALGA